jgi:hypothetical protein
MKMIKIFCFLLTALTVVFCNMNCPHQDEIAKNYHHEISGILRKILDDYFATPCHLSTNPAITKLFNHRQYSMTGQKILVLSIKKNDFYEYVVDIAIAPRDSQEQMKIWRFILQKGLNKEGEYGILEFKEHNLLSDKSKKSLFEKYNKYWIW